MKASSTERTSEQPLNVARRAGVVAIAALLAAGGYGLFSSRVSTVEAQAGGELQGLGTVTGSVTAGKPFKAAQVFIRSTDQRRKMLYMVFTQAGAFKAVALFPGNYEISVAAKGLESDTRPLVVKAGVNPEVKLAMKDAADPDKIPTSVDPSQARNSNGGLPAKKEIQLASYEEVYPPGPGRVVLEKTCMHCHGQNYFAINPRSAQSWRFGVDKMMGKNLYDKDRLALGEGFLSGNASAFHFGLQDRKDVVEYLTKNFGATAKPRAVKTVKEMPLDEAVLGKAQYIEYYAVAQEKEQAQALKPAVSADSESSAAGVAGVRITMQVTIDAQGNRWGVDRGVPSRLVKLDPRTGEFKSWVLPDVRAGVHDMTQDRQGTIWALEFSRNEDGHIDGMGTGSEMTSRLLGFNPKTEKWEHIVDLDPDNVIRTTRKGPIMGGLVDSKGKIWVHWMLAGAISSYDPVTKKAATYLIPTSHATPYGACIDPFDNIWVAEWNGGKMARFDQSTGSWTEFIPPNFPSNFRRGPESDADGNIWTGMWDGGPKIPGKVAKLDPKTGRWTMWDVPHDHAQPYEASLDRDGNIWFPDKNESVPDRTMSNVRFNPKDGTFLYYPRPQQIADSTRVNHAEDGSVHYTPRYGAGKDQSGFGVLYTDKDKITTLAPKMLNGAPGYAFKVPAPVKSNQ
jgi:streptogramin lyase